MNHDSHSDQHNLYIWYRPATPPKKMYKGGVWGLYVHSSPYLFLFMVYYFILTFDVISYEDCEAYIIIKNFHVVIVMFFQLNEPVPYQGKGP